MINPLRSLSLLVVSMFTTFAVYAAQVEISTVNGITVTQLDFPENDTPLMDSSVGLLDANLIKLRLDTTIASGFINMVRGGQWVVRNLPVLPEADYPYSNISVKFDLGVSEGTDVTSVEALLLYSDTLYQAMPSGSASAIEVTSQSVVQGGSLDEASGVPVNGAPTEAPVMAGISFGDVTNNRQIYQLDHPNLEAARNQCFPMGVANSLKFLANTTELKLPHSHVAGVEGDQSLVGQLGSLMLRTSTSRRVGSATFIGKGIRGKLKYLAENNLHERVETRHWGLFGSTNFAETVGENTAKSTGQGAINFDKLVDALDGGEDCEAEYKFPVGNGIGGHTVDVVAAGYIAGQPFMIENSDLNQSSDTQGAGKSGFLFSFLKDVDNDGSLNMNGTRKQLRLMMCQKFVPAKQPSGTSIPLPDTQFFIPHTSLKMNNVTDPAGHSCCAEFPPSAVGLRFENGQLIISSDAASVPWLPMTLTVDEHGGLNGSNTSSVAAFSNISNSIFGTIGPNNITAQISLGNNGGLPQGQPIKFDVTITPSDDWPWLFNDAPPELSPAIRVNGFRGAHSLAAGDPLSIGISLQPGVESSASDWWLIAEAGGSFYSYDAASANWLPGVIPTVSTPPVSLNSLPVHSFPQGLPSGEYKFYFGLDGNPDSNLDLETLVFDSVAVTIGEP